MLPQFGTAVRKKNLNSAVTADLGAGAPDKASVDAAWLVLEAANDLGDHAAIDACRRVIDAELNGTVAGSSDIDLVLGYFR
ncbi:MULTISPECIES: hypothetical protein [Bradyrhizobium]|jgi:hypothetical protein|uniref:Uncharacterized protein n=1 Tax=Bradyrhizobium ottawaense TaxID=931866 RepID=A0A2U8P9T9_9BRAD|nr:MULTISPECIES: hypothetical protein [Bradyrhizobium]AWL94521.1 hypothetical protein CIT37_21925 [Bradyrhizobium ottawaense]MBR1289406.1 hypothetical protein [Bradyrhizobium ottawaense]MBR1326980.1 hypothetical protein [Bradyrhizobium ottawaense]MBR1331350.1 hypothetical protein [Bradyrhizobium ottawaense]MBR1361899.1 hypothetical protein [Bradyrhizobium ottawaense]